jgi:hypothetical protein
MAKKDIVSKRLAEVTARANARFTINLQRAFIELRGKLSHAYGQLAPDEAGMRLRHVLALTAIAQFLERIGPDGDLVRFADQFAKLAQTLQDVDNGIPALIFTPTFPNRSDQTMVWLARARVALAVETMRLCGDSRKDAAKSVADKYPFLKHLITESGSDIDRGKSLEKAIISWCGDFSSRRGVKNQFAAQVYSICLDDLRRLAPNLDSDQKAQYAKRLLQEAMRPLI